MKVYVAEYRCPECGSGITTSSDFFGCVCNVSQASGESPLRTSLRPTIKGRIARD